MEKKDTSSTSRQKYTKEYKLEALRLASEGSCSIAETARRLGIKPEQLYGWKSELKQGEDAFRGNGHRTAEQARIHELEIEVRRLRMERDFLKKTAAYFAKDEK